MLCSSCTSTTQSVAANRPFHVCSGCHAIDWEHHGIGPDLFHVVNRKIGTSPDFKYSQAMKSFGGRWTPDRLDGFLKNPQAFMPGTAMRFPGVPDADTPRQTHYLPAKQRQSPHQAPAVPEGRGYAMSTSVSQAGMAVSQPT